MIEQLNCPKCGADITPEIEQWPDQDEQIEIECDGCEHKFFATACITLGFTMSCAGKHRMVPYIFINNETKTYDGKVWSKCMDCEYSGFVPESDTKTLKEWEEA